MVRRIKGPENDWRSVGRALRDVVLEGLGTSVWGYLWTVGGWVCDFGFGFGFCVAWFDVLHAPHAPCTGNDEDDDPELDALVV